MPKLFLIPNLLSEEGVRHIPPIVIQTIRDLDVFIVEGIRSSRRFIRKLIADYNIDEATFIEIDKHEQEITHREVDQLFHLKKNVGLMSEAGCPCLADPGHLIVDQARNKGYTIVPLTGPTSIVLALIASGFNGQQFTFHGYLPVKEQALARKLKSIEHAAQNTGYTQIWIETPYRNDKMIQIATKYLSASTMLVIACDLTSSEQEILKLPVNKWKNRQIGKRPAIFLLG